MLRAMTKCVVDPRETCGQCVGERVDEVILSRIARQVGERQHDYGKPRGRGGGLRRDACGRVGIEEPPRAARDHNQHRRERGDGAAAEPEPPLLRFGRRGRHGVPRRPSPERGLRPERVDPHRLGDVLDWVGPRSVTARSSRPSPHDRRLGQADAPGSQNVRAARRYRRHGPSDRGRLLNASPRSMRCNSMRRSGGRPALRSISRSSPRSRTPRRRRCGTPSGAVAGALDDPAMMSVDDGSIRSPLSPEGATACDPHRLPPAGRTHASTKIAAIFRFSLIAPSWVSTTLAQMPASVLPVGWEGPLMCAFLPYRLPSEKGSKGSISDPFGAPSRSVRYLREADLRHETGDFRFRVAPSWLIEFHP